MKTLLLTPLLAACVFASASADIPRDAPLTKYTRLWTDSPFTSKPPPPETAPTINPFEDFTLTGIAPVPGGHRITIVSKKNPDVKKVIEPGRSGDFTIVSVNRNPEQSLGTTVVLASGTGIQGTVRFEPDLITPKAAPAAQPQAQQPQNLPPGVNPAQVNPPNNPNQRQPRPRIVPPPTPAANNNATQGQSSGNNRNNRRGQSNERDRRRR